MPVKQLGARLESGVVVSRHPLTKKLGHLCAGSVGLTLVNVRRAVVDPLRTAGCVKSADACARDGDLGIPRVAYEVGVRRTVKRVVQREGNRDLGWNQPCPLVDEIESVVEELPEIGEPTVAGCNARVDRAEKEFAVAGVLRVVLPASKDAGVGHDGSALNQTGGGRDLGVNDCLVGQVGQIARSAPVQHLPTVHRMQHSVILQRCRAACGDDAADHARRVVNEVAGTCSATHLRGRLQIIGGAEVAAAKSLLGIKGISLASCQWLDVLAEIGCNRLEKWLIDGAPELVDQHQVVVGTGDVTQPLRLSDRDIRAAELGDGGICAQARTDVLHAFGVINCTHAIPVNDRISGHIKKRPKSNLIPNKIQVINIKLEWL